LNFNIFLKLLVKINIVLKATLINMSSDEVCVFNQLVQDLDHDILSSK